MWTRFCEISCSRGDEYEMVAFWDVVQCSLVEVGQCYRGARYFFTIVTHLEIKTNLFECQDKII
jgi:hypothetical protein